MAIPPREASADPSEEVELKLLLDPSAIDRVRHFEGFERRALEPARQRHLHSVYYDTRDLSLFEAGLALRVRRVGSQMLQTLKGRGGASAGLFSRVERRPVLAGRGRI